MVTASSSVKTIWLWWSPDPPTRRRRIQIMSRRQQEQLGLCHFFIYPSLIVLIVCPLSLISCFSFFLILKSMFSFLFLSDVCFVLQGRMHTTLAKLYLQPDSLQHSWGGNVCYKTFKCVCVSVGRGDWLKLVLLLHFTELLFISFFPSTLPFILSYSFSWCRPWNKDFFLSCTLQKEQSGAAGKRVL